MDWVLVAVILAIGLGVGVLWMWRFWALRTWRTVAVFAVAALLIGIALVWSPTFLLVAVPIAGIALWLAATGNQWLLSMPRQDYLYAEQLREADEEARRIITSPGNAEPEAIEALARVIGSISEPPPHHDWDPARSAKVEELSLARTTLADMDTSRDTADRLRALRAESRRLFFEARRARSTFWGMPR